MKKVNISLKQKLYISFLGTLIVPMAVLGIYSIYYSTNTMEVTQKNTIHEDLLIRKKSIEDKVTNLSKDLNFLHKEQSLVGTLRARLSDEGKDEDTGSTMAQLLDRLAGNAVELLQLKEAYTTFTYYDETNSEILKIVRVEDDVVSTFCFSIPCPAKATVIKRSKKIGLKMAQRIELIENTKQEFLDRVKKTDEVYISDLSLRKNSNGEVYQPYRPILRATVALKDAKGNYRGALSITYSGKILLEDIPRINEDKSGFLLVSKQGYFYQHRELINEWGGHLGSRSTFNSKKIVKNKIVELFIDDPTIKPIDKKINMYAAVIEINSKIKWLIIKSVPKSIISNKLFKFYKIFGLLVIISSILVIIFMYYIANSISNPVVAAAKAVSSIADGDLNQYVESTSNDEIGILADSINQTINRIENAFGSKTIEWMNLEKMKKAELAAIQEAKDEKASADIAGKKAEEALSHAKSEQIAADKARSNAEKAQKEADEAIKAAEFEKSNADKAMKEVEVSKRESEEATREANKSKNEAALAHESALKEKAEADTAKIKADEALTVAEQEKSKASLAASEAEEALRIAKDEKEKASIATAEAEKSNAAAKESLELVDVEKEKVRISSIEAEKAQVKAKESFEMAEKEKQVAVIANKEANEAKEEAQKEKQLAEEARVTADEAKNIAEKAKLEAENSNIQIESMLKKTEAEAQILHNKVNSILEVVSLAAEGDLTREIDVTGEDPIGQVGDALNLLLKNFTENLVKIDKASTRLYNSSILLKNNSEILGENSVSTDAEAKSANENSNQVLGGIKHVSHSMEEMVESISLISKTTHIAKVLTEEATTKTLQTSKIISKLGVSSKDIGSIIKSISSIAEQTNLLALNATIEAARAGESGKGFAVVASEVKELAKQTSLASNDITSKISNIQSDTSNAVRSINEISEAIIRVNENTAEISASIEEQSATTNQVSAIVGESSNQVSTIALNIASVQESSKITLKTVEENSKSANELEVLAVELKDLVSLFTLD